MTKKPIFKRERDKILRIFPKEPGRQQRVDVFLETRAGLSWPPAKSPGYFCVFGLEEASGDVKPLRLLAEGESAQMETLFDLYAVGTNTCCCEKAFARVEDNQGFTQSLRKFIRGRGIESPLPYDSTGFEDIGHSTALIKQLKTKQALIIPSGTILKKQINSITGDDLHDHFEDDFYAVAALCRVIASYEIYQYYKPGGGGHFSFTNFAHRTGPINSGGGYMEVITK